MSPKMFIFFTHLFYALQESVGHKTCDNIFTLIRSYAVVATQMMTRVLSENE